MSLRFPSMNLPGGPGGKGSDDLERAVLWKSKTAAMRAATAHVRASTCCSVAPMIDASMAGILGVWEEAKSNARAARSKQL